MRFLKHLLTSILGFFIAFFLLFALLISLAMAFEDPKEIIVSDATVLKIQLDSQIKDYAPKDMHPLAEVFGSFEEVLGLDVILRALEQAKNDSKIQGISLEIKNLRAGISQISALREALEDFKTSGKFVLSYADVYGQKEYYLSSVADSLFLNPMGQIDFKGLSSEVLFFKDFQDKYGVKMEVVRHGKYKSAVEPFIENRMSKANRKQIQELLQSLWSEMLTKIAASRNIGTSVLHSIADASMGRNAELAVANRLASAALYADEYRDKIKAMLQTESLNMLELPAYIQSGSGRVFRPATDRIAVVYAQGEIVYGKGDENYIGQETLLEALEKASCDENIKAIVLRVNSPGGSALASDLIWRGIERAKAKKPLVVSMGDLAASGGYYISCNADKIIAEPTTITGSIGVFGLLPNVSQLADQIGIHSEVVQTNSPAVYSIFQPMNASFYELTKEGVDRIYTTFVKKVARGRSLSFDRVDEIAQGRVWSGNQAFERGLVDELGGLDHAISVAASLAKVENYKVKNFPVFQKELRDVFQNLPFLKGPKSVWHSWAGSDAIPVFQGLQNLRNQEGIQARMPFFLKVN